MRRWLFLGVPAVAFIGMISMGCTVPAQDQAPPPYAVQGRGPVHEAFAAPVTGSPQPGPMAPQQPPEPIPEQPPAERPEGDNVEWIPGYWAWDDTTNQFLWVSGLWRQIPPGRRFVPGYWNQDGDNWRWISGFWTPAQQEQIAYYPEPPAPRETAPVTVAPTPQSIWSPGYWVFRGDRYYWVPGFWITARTSMVWVPAHYVWTPAGYLFVAGYWDYPPTTRGMIFAPVVFYQPVYTRPGFVYCPRTVLSTDLVIECCFVAPGRPHYYFGDYYTTVYVERGYRPYWQAEYRHYDPLFTYYDARHNHDPRWTVSLQVTFNDRLQGRAERPPVVINNNTYVVQNISNTTINNTTINNTTINKTVNNNSLQMVSFKGATQSAPPPKLVALSSTQVQSYQRKAVQIQQAAPARFQAEKLTARSNGGQPPRTGPVTLPVQKLNLPQPVAKAPQTGSPPLPGGNNTVQPKLPGSQPGVQPKLPGTQPGVQPKLPGTQPGVQPSLPGTQPGVQPKLPGTQPGVQPKLPGTQPGVQPTFPGTQPGVQPKLPGTQPGVLPKLPGTQPGVQPKLPGFQPGVQPKSPNPPPKNQPPAKNQQQQPKTSAVSPAKTAGPQLAHAAPTPGPSLVRGTQPRVGSPAAGSHVAATSRPQTSGRQPVTPAHSRNSHPNSGTSGGQNTRHQS
jgi:hypothetical protein